MRNRFLYLVFILLSSCSGTEAPQSKMLQSLQGRWQDLNDMNRDVAIDGNNFIDFYLGDTVSVKPFELYDNFPELGGQPAIEGKYIVLEQEPGTQYVFEIQQIDTLRLRLFFVKPGLTWDFQRDGTLPVNEFQF